MFERRDRALIAFAALTGARVNALASFRIGHVDLSGGFVEQDARTVRTKFAKTFRTYFMPVVDGAMEIVAEWIGELREEHLWGPDDPLFPATLIGLGETGGFEAQGLARHGWASTGPIRDIFKRGFAAADLPYFNPHSFRDMLVRHAMSLGPDAGGDEGVVAEPRSYGCADDVHELRDRSRAAAGRVDPGGARQSGGAGIDDRALLAALAARLGKGGAASGCEIG